MYDAVMNLSKDLVAASASPLILSLLEEGESYGYAIIQRVRELSDGEVEWTDGMLYPVLHRLEEAGYIGSAWRVAESGRNRKYYALKSKGRRALAEQRAQWVFVNDMFTKLWGTSSCSI
jgi:DNA-binding PadR family transcriptional regulator